MIVRLIAAGTLAACFTVTPAKAETRVLATSGLWSAYGGTIEDGRPVCGVTTIGGDGRRINVQQLAGDSGLDVALQKETWSIPRDTPVDLRVQFDLDEQIPSRAAGTGKQVGFHMGFEQSVPFMRKLRAGQQIRIYFASGNEPVWTGGLAGSGRAIDSFNACRASLGPSTPTQPFAQQSAPSAPPQPAPAPSTPTQPFAAAPLPSQPPVDPNALPPIPVAPP